MQINNIDIATYDATLIERYITNHEIVSVEDWLEGSPSPIFHREYSRYKNITLVVLIETVSDKEAEEQFSKLIDALRLCTIKFDDMDKLFDCKYSGQTEPEKLYNGIWKVTFEIMAYRTYKPETTLRVINTTSASILNAGTQETECKIEIVHPTFLTQFVITGLSTSPIIIRNLSAGKKYVIDGYKFMYTEDGASDIDNYDSFEFPVLQAGTNNITFNTSTADVTIKYFQKFN